MALICVELDSPANKMQRRTEKFGAQPPVFDPASSAETEVLRSATTYLAKIAVVLQDAPNKMLTFTRVRKCLSSLYGYSQKIYTKKP